MELESSVHPPAGKPALRRWGRADFRVCRFWRFSNRQFLAAQKPRKTRNWKVPFTRRLESRRYGPCAPPADFNAKTQRGQSARRENVFTSTLRLCTLAAWPHRESPRFPSEAPRSRKELSGFQRESSSFRSEWPPFPPELPRGQPEWRRGQPESSCFPPELPPFRSEKRQFPLEKPPFQREYIAIT